MTNPKAAADLSDGIAPPDSSTNSRGYVTCRAKSSTTGQRCGQRPIPGGFVCRYHGGSAPQVQRKASMRLAELVMPAIAVLAREMVKADKSADKQRAANSILDRAGITRGQSAEIDAARDLLLARLLDKQAELAAAAAADDDLPELEALVVVDDDPPTKKRGKKGKK